MIEAVIFESFKGSFALVLIELFMLVELSAWEVEKLRVGIDSILLAERSTIVISAVNISKINSVLSLQSKLVPKRLHLLTVSAPRRIKPNKPRFIGHDLVSVPVDHVPIKRGIIQIYWVGHH